MLIIRSRRVVLHSSRTLKSWFGVSDNGNDQRECGRYKIPKYWCPAEVEPGSETKIQNHQSCTKKPNTLLP